MCKLAGQGRSTATKLIDPPPLSLNRLVGSYDALRGGSTAEGMEDFTGGMTEMIDLGSKAPDNLFSIMLRAHSRCSLLACSIDAKPNEMEADGPLGLIMGHAYSITDVRVVSSIC